MTIELIHNLIDNNDISIDSFFEQSRHVDLEELEKLMKNYQKELENDQIKNFKDNFNDQIKKYKFVAYEDEDELSKMSLEVDSLLTSFQVRFPSFPSNLF